MSVLKFQLIESKRIKNHCKVTITCSADIQDQIMELAKEAYEVELLQSGTIEANIYLCTIKFTLTDPEKITKLRTGIMAAFMKNSKPANFNEN